MPWNLIRYAVIASTHQLPIAASRNISAPWRLAQLWHQLCRGLLEKCPTHSAQWAVIFAQGRGEIHAVAMLGCAVCQSGSVGAEEQQGMGSVNPRALLQVFQVHSPVKRDCQAEEAALW